MRPDGLLELFLCHPERSEGTRARQRVSGRRRTPGIRRDSSPSASLRASAQAQQLSLRMTRGVARFSCVIPTGVCGVEGPRIRDSSLQQLSFRMTRDLPRLLLHVTCHWRTAAERNGAGGGAALVTGRVAPFWTRRSEGASIPETFTL